MGTLNLYTVKDRHKKFLQKELKHTQDPRVKAYLSKMISSIEGELDQKKDSYYINEDVTEQLLPIMSKLGLNKYSIVILTALLCNDSIGASRLASQIRIDRALTYRTLNHLIKIRIATAIESTVKQYFIQDKDNPFSAFVDNGIEELEALRNFKPIQNGMKHKCKFCKKEYNCNHADCNLVVEASCNKCYDKGLIE